jgi:hypothetical protein
MKKINSNAEEVLEKLIINSNDKQLITAWANFKIDVMRTITWQLKQFQDKLNGTNKE